MGRSDPDMRNAFRAALVLLVLLPACAASDDDGLPLDEEESASAQLSRDEACAEQAEAFCRMYPVGARNGCQAEYEGYCGASGTPIDVGLHERCVDELDAFTEPAEYAWLPIATCFASWR